MDKTKPTLRWCQPIQHWRHQKDCPEKSLEWIIKDAKMLKASLAKMSENYKNLNIPIEIFHGTSDKIVPLELHAKNFHEKVFSSKLTKLKGIGHMPHHFRKNIILQSIVSLLVKR